MIWKKWNVCSPCCTQDPPPPPPCTDWIENCRPHLVTDVSIELSNISDSVYTYTLEGLREANPGSYAPCCYNYLDQTGALHNTSIFNGIYNAELRHTSGEVIEDVTGLIEQIEDAIENDPDLLCDLLSYAHNLSWFYDYDIMPSFELVNIIQRLGCLGILNQQIDLTDNYEGSNYAFIGFGALPVDFRCLNRQNPFNNTFDPFYAGTHISICGPKYEPDISQFKIDVGTAFASAPNIITRTPFMYCKIDDALIEVVNIEDQNSQDEETIVGSDSCGDLVDRRQTNQVSPNGTVSWNEIDIWALMNP